MIATALIPLLVALATATPEAPTPAPTTTATPLVEPSASPSPEVSPAPTARPTPSPVATPVYRYRFVPQPPKSPDPSAPQIYAVYLSNSQFHSHDTIAIRVVTNAAVTKVVSSSQGHSGSVPQTGPGEFTALSKLPAIPFIAKGLSINLDFIAYSADGRSMTVHVPVRLG